MTWYVYPSMVAVDATGNVLRSGSGQIFAESDESGTTPLPLRDLNGLTITEIQINDLGLTESFQVEQPEVVWRSGSFAVPLSSPKGMREAAEMAQEAASLAQLAANTAAASAVAAAEDAADAAASAGGGTAGGGLGNVVVMPVWNGVGAQPARVFPPNYPPALAGTVIPEWVVVRWRQPVAPTNKINGDEWRRTGA
jgi:hypothetical protein